MLNKNYIQLKYGFVNLNIASKNVELADMPLVMSVQSELMQLGYMLNVDVLNYMTTCAKVDVIAFHNDVLSNIRKDLGISNGKAQAFWSNFPNDVMSKSECELWLHQTAHYISNGSYLPTNIQSERQVAFEKGSYTILELGNEDKFMNIFTDIVSVNQSLSPGDREIMEWFVKNNIKIILPDVIPFKENLCTLYALGLPVKVNTVTDVLRIAVHMSGGDISLPAVKHMLLDSWTKTIKDPKFMFKKFSKTEVKRLLNTLNNSNCDASEGILYAERWKRLGEILHPGSYKKAYPKAWYFFYKVRNKTVRSWYSKLNSEFQSSLLDGLDVLVQRPGEFARRLDWLLRTNSNNPNNLDVILNTMYTVLPKVSNKVLYELYGHMSQRDTEKTRSIMIKGARKRTELSTLPALDVNVIEAVQNTIKAVLKNKFLALPELGNVFLSEDLKKIPIPTNLRSLNPSSKPIMRGQRVKMGNGDAKVIRAYTHWFDKQGNQDIDMAAYFVGLGKSKMISWNCSHSEPEGYFSGDIRYRQGSCAEYIDIVFKNALKNGFKYVILTVHNFQGGTLAEIEDCVFGYMERKHPSANEIFKPNTTVNSVRLMSPASTSIPVVIDLETQEYIYIDIDVSGIPVQSANANSILDAISYYTEDPKFSAYDLLKLHIEARGKEVSEVENADLVLDTDKFSTSFVEIMKWMGV